MTIERSYVLVLLFGMLLGTSACSSSDSDSSAADASDDVQTIDDQEQVDTAGGDALDIEQQVEESDEVDPPVEQQPMGETEQTDLLEDQQQVDTPATDPLDIEQVEGPEEANPLGEQEPIDDPEQADPLEEQQPEQNLEEENITDEQQPEQNLEGENTTDGQQVENPESDPVFIPQVAAGSELERLINGLTQQAAITLLDLNTRISQGEELTDQQEQCLGSFEEGFGQPLIAISCDQALATGEIFLLVSDAAFYDTAECNAALMAGNADGCILRTMNMQINTRFTTPEVGLPRPDFPGTEVTYSTDDASLVIENTPDALTGVFSCQTDLENGGSMAEINTTDCDELLNSTADEIEDRQSL